MFSLASVALAFTAVSAVSGLVIPRDSVPAGWRADILEPYSVYHAWYLAAGCMDKHDLPFFDLCCHPLKKDETREKNRPKQCDLSFTSSSVTAVVPTPTAPADDDDDEVDCDDEDEHQSSTPIAPVPTKTSVVTPTKPPAVTPPASPLPATTSTKTTVKPSPTPPPANNGGNNNVNLGGFATFFYQNGVAGACGTVHRDDELVAAIDSRRYGNTGVKSATCGRKVRITNPDNNKSVVVKIADACPTCKNPNSIDLSVGAFKQIATEAQGMVPITWTFED